jgi:CRISPR-associated endonuclease Csy4
MRYYQEITLIEQVEISPYFIWSKLYGQLHIAFVEIKKQNNQANIGASFPQYIYQKNEVGKSTIVLGTKLRLFAEIESTLQQFNIFKWLERLTDYVHISSIRLVPQEKVTAYVTFQRKQVKTNAERLARHRVKTRNDISFDDAVKLYQNRVTTTDLPFIQMKSLTSDQGFKLFIEKRIALKSSESKFNTYGLSSNSTVPEF